MIWKKTWSSIRWKIVFIYFLLVFIATTIIGIFIMNQLESYYMDSVRDNLTRIVHKSGMITSLSEYDDLNKHKDEIQDNIDAWTKGFEGEIFVVNDDYQIIASNNENVIESNAIDLLDKNVVVQGLNGEKAESNGLTTTQKQTKNLGFPISNLDTKGVLYLRSDLTSIYKTINRSKEIFVKAMVLALFITVVLGFIIAKSITVPINDVTEKAEKMAQGDFSQEVSVKSDDEIGRLAEMFNFLRMQLTLTLSEISNEKTKLETILRYMTDGLIAVSLTGNIIHANPAAMKMLHISEDDIKNKNYDDIIKDYNSNLILENLMKNSEGSGSEENFDYTGCTFAVRYGKFKDENDLDVGIIMMIQDITARQKLENMQMDFVANVSHELKTPLTSIKSYTETLMDGGVEDKEIAQSFLKIIDVEADRMNRLVKDLLQLSRLDYQQEKLFKKDSNLISLLKSVVTKVELTVKNKNQHLNCIFDINSKVMVVIDKDRMEQVFLNVLSNAIKYTQDGGRIDIDVIKKDSKAEIIITDNGIGISEAEIPRVFERFYRVDKARSRAMGGTGLGLAISKQIVEEHNGGITIESKEGKGTKAIIILPLAPMRGIRNIE
ncbi:sensor histidine kinase [Anaerovorax odorimutans]|uniref:sensor histidine kinase n=1 Tax=Anaerovorax odorimutans TaxID=109327 RepID=UPI00041F7BD3|nr:ATP-binding protein [Anaerovorax odorimutans]